MNITGNILKTIGIKPNSLVKSLLRIPPKEHKRDIPKLKVYKRDSVDQADLLFLPNDNGFRYLLVIVDCATRSLDAEPLKTKQPKEVLKGIKKIYKRKYLNIPSDFFCVDAGNEFKGEVKRYFNDHNVIVRVGKPGRHRQQCLVEYFNGVMGKILNQIMLINEIKTGNINRQWVRYVKIIIDELNKKYFRKVVDRISKPPHAGSNEEEELLKEGTKVRIKLDKPMDYITGKRLHGKFRQGDIRWEAKIRTIEQLLLRPEQVPMYLVSGIKNTAFTRKQLQVIDTDKEYEDSEYIVEKIVGKTKKNGRIYYEIKWRGYAETTLEPRKELIKDIPEMIKQYEKAHKK